MGSSNRTKTERQEIIEIDEVVLTLLSIIKESTKSAENEVKRRIKNYAEGDWNENE